MGRIFASRISYPESLTTKLLGIIKKNHRHERTIESTDIYIHIVNLLMNLFP